MSLTKLEQETVITFNAAEKVARVTTHMKRVITKLDRNPNARQLARETVLGTEGVTYELPVQCISFRKGKLGLIDKLEGQADAPDEKKAASLECRHGCGKTFQSKQGRKNHEIKVHGSEGTDAQA